MGGGHPWTLPMVRILLVRPPGQLYGASYARPRSMTSLYSNLRPAGCDNAAVSVSRSAQGGRTEME